MKKIFSLGLMLVALTLMNCSKEEIVTEAPAVNGAAFELFASTEDGRTVNDGWSTLWDEGDQINVFHAVAGTTEYKNDTPYQDGASHPFTVANTESGLFVGDLMGGALAEGTNYDWYLFYPYSSFITTPANDSAGYTYIGSRSDRSQAQTGVDNMTHIAGSNYPLYGKALNVPAEEAPVATMRNIASLIEFAVKNTLSEAIAISEIQFTSTTDIVGSYFIDFSGETLGFTPSNTSYVSSTAKLGITDATIAAGATAKFYLAVKPHAVSAGDLTIKVTADAGACTKTLEGVTTTFTAGKVKTINFSFDAPEEVETIADGDYVIVAEATNGYCAMSVQADDDRRAYTLLNDWNAESATYTTSDADLVWQIKAVDGGYTISNNGQYISWVSGNKAPLSSTAYAVAIAPQADGTNYITTSGGARILAKNAEAQYGFGFYETAKVSGIKNLYLKPVNFVKLPDLAWGEESTAIAYDDVAAHTITVTTDATNVSVAAYDDESYSAVSTWLTTSYADGVLTYQATSQNESADPRNAYIVATTSNENGSKVYTLVITQAGKPATGGTETTVTYDFTKIDGFSTWTTSYGQHVVTYDEATVDFTKHNRQTGTITDCPVGKGAPVTIVMTNQSTIKSVKFVCKKWTTKAQTITLHYSINGGTSYSTTGITSTNFEIESTELPAGTNAVKITFSSTNQVGIASATLTYVK